MPSPVKDMLNVEIDSSRWTSTSLSLQLDAFEEVLYRWAQAQYTLIRLSILEVSSDTTPYSSCAPPRYTRVACEIVRSRTWTLWGALKPS